MSRTIQNDLPKMSMFFDLIFKKNHLEYVSYHFGAYFKAAWNGKEKSAIPCRYLEDV